MSLQLAWALIPCWFYDNLCSITVFFMHGSINKITSRNKCTNTQDVTWENPHGGEKPSKPFPYVRVSSYNVKTCLGMPPTKSSEGEGNVPRARTYQPTEKLFTRCAITKNTSAQPRREKDISQSVNWYEWMRSDSLLYLYMINHKPMNKADNKNNRIIILYNKIFIN